MSVLTASMHAWRARALVLQAKRLKLQQAAAYANGRLLRVAWQAWQASCAVLRQQRLVEEGMVDAARQTLAKAKGRCILRAWLEVNRRMAAKHMQVSSVWVSHQGVLSVMAPAYVSCSQ